MSKSPFYSTVILSNGQDITDRISGFSHEDCIEEDDLVKFTLHDLDKSFIDNPAFVEGAEISFHYGFIGFKYTDTSIAVIKKIETSYGKQIDLVVTCLDKGSNFKQTTSSKIWKQLTASEIVTKICSKYGMDVVSDPTKKKYESLVQGGRTDFSFIRYLTETEDGGSYIFYIKGNTAYFVKRDLKKEAIAEFNYEDNDGKIIDFKVTQKDEGDNKGKTQVEVNGIDPITGEVINESVDASNVESDGSLGAYSIDANGRISSQVGVEKENTTGKSLAVPVTSKEDAKNIANKEHKSDTLSSIEATLIIEGEPMLKAGDIISISGVGQKHSGNWYIFKITHDIGNGGYVTTIQLKKNATKAPVSKDAEENVPAEDQNITIDADGNLITNGKTLTVVDSSGKKVPDSELGKYKGLIRRN